MFMWLKDVFKRFFGHEEKKLIEQPEVACALQEQDTELCGNPVVAEPIKKPVKKSGKKRGRPRKKVKKEEA